jgi:hypothetical protein
VAANARAAQNNQNYVANLQRTKRSLEPSAREFNPVLAKKARITVEIPSRAAFHSRTAREATDAKKAPPPNPPTASQQRPTTAKPTAVTNGARPHSHAPAPAPRVAEPMPSTRGAQHQQQHAPTRHKEKVGKHELSKLLPNLVDTNSQGRKLRSQEATRFKSELSAYFQDYDEVIGNEPKETRKNSAILSIATPPG